jgi:dimethylargininase
MARKRTLRCAPIVAGGAATFAADHGERHDLGINFCIYRKRRPRMPTSLAITRRPGPDLTRVELTHLPRVAIDPLAAEAQHRAYRGAIAALGLELLDLPALPGFPDAVFVEDALIALPEVFVVCRPGAASRAGEVASLEAAAPRDRAIRRLAPPARLDGGDVLRIGRTLYVGLSSRSNAAAADQLRSLLAPFGYGVEAVGLAGALHLKTAVTAPDEETLLFNPAWVDPALFGARRRIEVAPPEPFAANALAVAGRVFVQAAHPRTAERLDQAGFVVEAIDTSELAKAEAGLTCMSVIVPPATSGAA